MLMLINCRCDYGTSRVWMRDCGRSDFSNRWKETRYTPSTSLPPAYASLSFRNISLSSNINKLLSFLCLHVALDEQDRLLVATGGVQCKLYDRDAQDKGQFTQGFAACIQRVFQGMSEAKVDKIKVVLNGVLF